MSFKDLLLILRTRLLPLPDGNLAACNAFALRHAMRNGMPVAATVQPETFLAAVDQLWGTTLRDEARWGLSENHSNYSARKRFSPGQIATGLLVLCACLGAVNWGGAGLLADMAMFAAALLFLVVVLVRMFVLLPYDQRDATAQSKLADDDLPIYSVLVPLFNETRTLDQLLSALGDLDYPAAKLDIKILVEEFDRVTRDALRDFILPEHFEVIVVPAGIPRTKPRALNYGLLFARGELLTIYDAEDVPAPRQLRLCAQTFAASSPKLVCLQAQLTIYNANENWLTRQFALEYGSLFGEILPGLAAYGLPLPLGGTSNHFRVSCLRKAGAWDPYNVTEDADLGIRMARQGYATSTVDSATFEEACVNYRDWKRQRARWLKGFLQTWLVHMRTPLTTFKQLGGIGFLVFQAVTIGVFVSALLHPLLLAGALWQLVSIAGEPQSLAFLKTWMNGYSLMILVAGYGASIWIAARTMRRQPQLASWSGLLSLPFYWMLLTPAAWLALWQFISDLHGWNKTPHGKSRLMASGAPDQTV